MKLKLLAISLITIVLNSYPVDEPEPISMVKFHFDTNQKRTAFQNAISNQLADLDIYALSKTASQSLFILNAALTNAITPEGFQTKLRQIIHVSILQTILNTEYIS